jgi:hypothetical protein
MQFQVETLLSDCRRVHAWSGSISVCPIRRRR